MKNFKAFIYAALGFLILSTAAIAHHSTNGIYHDEEVLEISGKVLAWRFINPHPFLTIEVEGDDGMTHEWDVSFGGSAVTHLRRRGYTSDTFATGETIIVRGNPARATGVYGLLVERENPTREDGSPLF